MMSFMYIIILKFFSKISKLLILKLSKHYLYDHFIQVFLTIRSVYIALVKKVLPNPILCET